jgi:hypothetical protein
MEATIVDMIDEGADPDTITTFYSVEVPNNPDPNDIVMVSLFHLCIKGGQLALFVPEDWQWITDPAEMAQFFHQFGHYLTTMPFDDTPTVFRRLNVDDEGNITEID